MKILGDGEVRISRRCCICQQRYHAAQLDRAAQLKRLERGGRFSVAFKRAVTKSQSLNNNLLSGRCYRQVISGNRLSSHCQRNAELKIFSAVNQWPIFDTKRHGHPAFCPSVTSSFTETICFVDRL